MRKNINICQLIHSLIKRHVIDFEYELPQNILMISQLCINNILTNFYFIVNGILILLRNLDLILLKTNINIS